MLAVILKFLTPVLAFYFLQKWLRQSISMLPKIDPNKIADRYPRKPKKDEDVLEICPDCGNVKIGQHRCQF